MVNYKNEKIKFVGCPGCAYGRHEFELPCKMAYENERFTLSQDWELPILGFLVLAPKQHIEKLEEFSTEERNEMFDIVNKTIKILRENNICDKFNVVFEEKRHFHIWIMPRHKWMSELAEEIIENIEEIFKYAKENFRNEEVYNKIEEISLIVKKEFEK